MPPVPRGKFAYVDTDRLVVGPGSSDPIQCRATDDESLIVCGTEGAGAIFSDAGALKFLADGGLIYGGIYAVENSTATAISSSGVAVQVTIFDTNQPSNLATPDHTNDHITIDHDGDYLVNLTATVNSVAGASSKFEMTAQKNNGAAILEPIHFARNIAGGGGSSGVGGMEGIVALSADDTVEAWIENQTNAANYVVEYISLLIKQVGG